MSFDWTKAVERNSEALSAIVATLFGMLGLDVGGNLTRIRREYRRDILRLLQPAEAALRRLIVIAARGLVVKPAPSRPKPKDRVLKKSGKKGSDASPIPPFQLFDTRKRFDRPSKPTSPRPERRLRSLDVDPTWRPWHGQAPAPEKDPTFSAEPLYRRFEALKRALEDLPGQAKRYARWKVRREKIAKTRSTFNVPMRPGKPPGHRKKPTHEVDHVLTECHALAWSSLKPDTS